MLTVQCSYSNPDGSVVTNNYIADANGFRSSLAPSNGPLLPLVGKAPKVPISHAPITSKHNSLFFVKFLLKPSIFIAVAAAPIPVAPIHVAPFTPLVKGE